MNEQIDVFDYIKYFFKKLSIAKHTVKKGKRKQKDQEKFLAQYNRYKELISLLCEEHLRSEVKTDLPNRKKNGQRHEQTIYYIYIYIHTYIYIYLINI